MLSWHVRVVWWVRRNSRFVVRCLLVVVASFGFGSSLHALRAETMVDGLPRASTFWDRRGVWENLFHIEFASAKVGSRLSILWC